MGLRNIARESTNEQNRETMGTGAGTSHLAALLVLAMIA
jgi:hypothetical protein